MNGLFECKEGALNMEVLFMVAGLFLLLIVVLLVRTVNFKPKTKLNQEKKHREYDYENAYKRFQKMIQIPTISNRDSQQVDWKQFAKFEKLLQKEYPLIHKHCKKQKIDETGLLFRFQGKQSADPTVLMAHYDVVPVGDESKWVKPPFSGAIEDGVLWGRGTIDTKITLFSAMEAIEYSLEKGIIPDNDIYLAFAGDEEVAGTGAPSIVQYFKDHDIHPKLVVDEGGAIVESLFPGVIESIAVVGVGEKGPMDLSFYIEGRGGHASTPPKHTAVGELAAAIEKAENTPFKSDFNEPLLGLIDAVGRYSSFGLRFVFANLWLFKPVLVLLFGKMGGEVDAMMHTTQAFTMFEAGIQSNVLPPDAKAIANFRIEKKDTIASVIAHLRKAMNNDSIKIEIIHGSEASPYSPTNNMYYEKVKQAIGETWSNTIVSPYLMVAASDARHYHDLCEVVLRFSAMRLSKEQRGLIHNYNERIELVMIQECIQFYLNLVEKC